MKRRWWTVVGIAAFSVVAVIVALSLFHEDNITPENVAKIKGGMTEKEVVQLFGRNADEVAPAFDHVLIKQTGTTVLERRQLERRQPQKIWHGASMTVAIGFSDDGKVDANYVVIEMKQTTWDKIRDFVGLTETTIAPPPLPSFPPSPPYQLPDEFKGLEKAANKAYDNPESK